MVKWSSTMVTRHKDKEMTTFTINFGKTVYSHAKEWRWDPFITPYISINSNGLRAKLNVWNYKPLYKKGEKHRDIEMVKYCLHMTSKSTSLKKIKINGTTSNLKTSVQETAQWKHNLSNSRKHLQTIAQIKG